MAEEQCEGLGRRLEPVRSTVGGSDPGGRAAVACCLRRRRPVLNLGRKRMRRETQHAGGPLGPRSSPINDPDAKFSHEEPEFFHKERKRSKKKERFGRGGLWKLLRYGNRSRWPAAIFS